MAGIREGCGSSAWGNLPGKHAGSPMTLVLIAIAEVVLLARIGSAQVLDVLEIPQRGSYWCWAASAEMVLDYLAPSETYRAAVGQCTLVRSLPQVTCSCDPPDNFNV